MEPIIESSFSGTVKYYNENLFELYKGCDDTFLTYRRDYEFTNKDVKLLTPLFTLTHLALMLGMNPATHIVSLLRYALVFHFFSFYVVIVF